MAAIGGSPYEAHVRLPSRVRGSDRCRRGNRLSGRWFRNRPLPEDQLSRPARSISTWPGTTPASCRSTPTSWSRCRTTSARKNWPPSARRSSKRPPSTAICSSSRATPTSARCTIAPTCSRMRTCRPRSKLPTATRWLRPRRSTRCTTWPSSSWAKAPSSTGRSSPVRKRRWPAASTKCWSPTAATTSMRT